MKVTLERLPESRVQLAIEVDQDRVEKSLDAAYKRLAARSRIPGFRPGKAPRHIVERHFGRDGLIREALDRLVPDVYNEAIESEDVDAIAQPELEILELEPVRFRATVAVRPSVNLDDYASIRVVAEHPEVTGEQFAEQMLVLRRRFATLVPVERGAKWDDVITADIEGEAEGEVFVKDEDAEFPLREGQTLLLEGLAEAFIGMKKGDAKSIDLQIPEDFRSDRLQGKQATIRLAVKEVKEEQLPADDDEFAAQVNAAEFPTLAALKERLKNDLQKALQEEADGKLRNEAVDKLVEGATIEYPRILVEREIDHIIQDSMNDRAAYANYLARVGRSEAEYRDTLREAAEGRVRRSLALSQLAEDEKIEVDETDVEAELDSLTAPMGDDAARFREMFASAEGLTTIRRNLLSKKTLDRLAQIVTADAPAAPKAKAAAAKAAVTPKAATPKAKTAKKKETPA